MRATGVCVTPNEAVEKCVRVGEGETPGETPGEIPGEIPGETPGVLGVCTAALGEGHLIISHLVEYQKFAPYLEGRCE